MNPQRIAIKLFASPDPTAPVDLEPFTPLFHEFIQKASVPGLLVDVADYAHVPNGPGIILIGHDVDYGIDSVGGLAGLLVVRKRYGVAALAGIVRDTLSMALACAKAIEDDGRTGLHFDAAATELQILDRLEAPNDEATFDLLRSDLEPVFAELYGGCTVERGALDDARKPATLIARATGEQDLAGLLARIGSGE
jgi:hypothetical protein